MIEDFTFWTTIATTAVGVITTITTIITNKNKNKSKKLVELAKIVQKCPGYIQEAENIFGSGTGTAKMAYVLNKVQMDCITRKVEYNEDQFKGEIENILNTPESKKRKACKKFDKYEPCFENLGEVNIKENV